VAAIEEVSVPAQHRVRTYQQPEPTKRRGRDAVQECGEQRSVGGGEPRPRLAELAFQDGDLVA
jgi:hypothetical protein